MLEFFAPFRKAKAVKKLFEFEKDVSADALPGVLTQRHDDGWQFVAIIPNGRIASPTWDVIFCRVVDPK